MFLNRITPQATEGTVAEWLCAEGDEIKEGEDWVGVTGVVRGWNLDRIRVSAHPIKPFIDHYFGLVIIIIRGVGDSGQAING